MRLLTVMRPPNSLDHVVAKIQAPSNLDSGAIDPCGGGHGKCTLDHVKDEASPMPRTAPQGPASGSCSTVGSEAPGFGFHVENPELL